ncbi:MAG: MoxR family ATPase [Gemmatimonadota bacterium]|nr:MoxR family ATPase [Gemmatimonadota bacterium]
MSPKASATADDELKLLKQLADAKRDLLDQVGRRVVGQHQVLEDILVAVLSRGHALLVGVPGLAKTLMVSTMAEALKLEFSRIQFTPDLMPGDITGTEIIEEDLTTGKRIFRFVKGPVFANVVLADEINRTPPKTQAALLQAMQEHEVTAAGTTYKLPEPFFVLSTQNPIEQEGTYPLPEAQLDRFMFELKVDYPSREEEERIVFGTTGDELPKLKPVLDAQELMDMQRLVRRIPAPENVIQAAVELARMTRPSGEGADPGPLVKEYVDWGAGPRASQYLVLGAKARAALDGRPMADLDDVKSVALPVLRHRVMVNFAAEAAGRTAADVCRELIDDGTWMKARS